MPRDQVNFRCNRELKIRMMELDLNQSKFINDAIEEKFIKIKDPKIIDNKIIEYEQKIKELKELKKQKNVDQDKINELLSYHAPNYKKNAPFRSESQRIKFLEKAVKPQLKKYGYKGSMEELDNLLINWRD